MTTKAIKVGEYYCRHLHADCLNLLLVIRDEQREHFIPVRASFLAALVAIFSFAVMAFMVDNHGMLLSALGFFALVAGTAGLVTWGILDTIKASHEVSNYLYKVLTEMSVKHPDLEDLRNVRSPLTLSDLRRHLLDLMGALESDISKPNRSIFFTEDSVAGLPFKFNHEPRVKNLWSDSIL
ncbi:hypothetical protein IFT48_02440 [Pseudomonas fluorescens]|uniref:hypothetical protein n=1 Tax=Pseudomonas fluorescens TaxID=294 RepID=UPI001930C4C9|nr:hypothetical protein [Pseudomonas fluorescens]MBD8088823.1 hypothetical protein [Pseudomonas fluorescens]